MSTLNVNISAESKKFEIAILALLALGWVSYSVNFYKSTISNNQNSIATVSLPVLPVAPQATPAPKLNRKSSAQRIPQNIEGGLPLAVEQANVWAKAFVVSMNETDRARTLTVNGDWLLLTDGNRTRVSSRNFQMLVPALNKLQFDPGKLKIYIDSRSDANPVHIRTLEKFITTFKGWKPTLRVNDSLATQTQLTYEVIK